MSTEIRVRPESSEPQAVKCEAQCNMLEEMEAFERRVRERAFDLFQRRSPWDGNEWDDWFKAESEMLKPIPLELSETGDSYSVRAEVPGFHPGDLTVQAEGNSVCIHGRNEKKKENSGKGRNVKYTEISASEVCRRIDFPGAINAEKAKATLANGVLTVELPKAGKPKSIEVKAA